MSNEVEINVKSNDKTDFSKIKSKAKAEGGKSGDEYGKSFGSSLKRWFTGSGRKVGEDGGRESGKGFGAGMKKWFVGDGGGLFKQIGKNSGTVFGSGMLGAIKTPILGPAILGILAGAVAVAAPAAGAIAGTGLVAGFGLGLAGLGLTLAAKSKPVEDKWAATMKRVGDKSKLMAAPFESTLIGIADTFEHTFDHFEPTLNRVFGKLAGPVRGFADDVGKAFEELIPALDPVANATDKVLEKLGPALQDTVHSVSAGMSDLANSVAKNPNALADTARGIGDVARQSLDLLKNLNDMNGSIEHITGGLSAVDIVMAGLSGTLGGLNLAVAGGSSALGALDKLTTPVGQGFTYTATTAKEAATAAGYWTQGLSKAQLAAMGITGAAKEAGGATESMTDKFNRQKSKTDALLASLFQLQNGYLQLSGAQISYQAALDAGTKSAKENGKTLDINTEKGRNNMTALNQLAQATNGQTESMIRNNKGTTAAYRTAAVARENFVRLAQQMGATKPQAEAMARSMIAIPNVSREARLKANKADLDAKLAAAKKQLADPKLTATKRAKLEATIAQLQKQIASAQATINGLHGKTVVANVITKYTSVGSRSSGVGVGGGHQITGKGSWDGGIVMPALARGGSPLSARQFLAGEYGAEIVDVDGTGNVRVTPAGNTARRLKQAGGMGGVQEIRLVLEGRGDVGDFLIKMLQPAIRDRGGNVNVVLAGKPS